MENPDNDRKKQPRSRYQAERPSRDSPSLTSVGFLLHLAQRRISEGVAAALEGTGLHPGLLAVLGALDDRGPMNQRRLTEVTRVEKSSMVIFVDMLEAGGWVRRVRDPSDRRAQIVEMTEEGQAKFRLLGPKMQDVQDRFLDPLSSEEREMLVSLLKRVSGRDGG